MNLSNKYRFTLSNASGSNDCHLSGRLVAFSVIQAMGQALALWPFEVEVQDVTLDFCGVVEESPADTIARINFEED